MMIDNKVTSFNLMQQPLKEKLGPYPNLLIYSLTHKTFIWGQELGQILKINGKNIWLHFPPTLCFSTNVWKDMILCFDVLFICLMEKKHTLL